MGLPVGFLFLRYSGIFTVESVSLLYLLVMRGAHYLLQHWL